MNYSKYLDRDGMIRAICDAIRHESVRVKDDSGYPYGKGVHDCLVSVLKQAEELGFRTFNMDDQVGWAEYGDGKDLVIVLGHLDVVAAGEGWTVDPFGGIIQDGRIYGRGATDDKGPILAALYALKAVVDSGEKLSRRVRILFGCNEETGCADIAYYLEHGGETPVSGFTPDGNFPLVNGEKGIATETYYRPFQDRAIREISGGVASNVVPNKANAVLSDGKKIAAEGKSAHGATPEKGVNAIGLLIRKLVEELPEGDTKDAFRFLNDKIGTETDGKSLGIATEDAESGKLSFNLGTIRGDEQGVEIVVNYRTPVTSDLEKCVRNVEDVFKKAGFEKKSSSLMKPLYYPKDAPMIRQLTDAYHELTGLPSDPIVIGGGTYAKELPNIVAFGPCFPGDEVTEHEADEYIALDRLNQCADIYAESIARLAR